VRREEAIKKALGYSLIAQLTCDYCLKKIETRTNPPVKNRWVVIIKGENKHTGKEHKEEHIIIDN